MPFAVFNMHTRSVEITEDGSYTHDGKWSIKAGEPLHVAETFATAEIWRIEKLKGLKNAQSH